MGTDNRNAYVVVFFVAALTLGAALLRWLEPGGAPALPGGTLLMMEQASAVDRVTIGYAPQESNPNLDEFGGVIDASGKVTLNQSTSPLRLLIVGGDSGRLSDAQARSLLSLLGKLSQTRGLDLRQVELDAGSDSRRSELVPRGAHDLTDLLRRKDFIR